jgi:hypothetical protein
MNCRRTQPRTRAAAACAARSWRCGTEVTMLAALYRYAAVPARSRRIRKAPQRLAGAGHTGTAEDAKPGTAEDTVQAD